MKKAKIWFASGLVLLLFGIGYGANVLRHTLDEGKVNTYKAQPTFSEQVIDYGAFGKDVYELQGRLAYLGFYHGKLDSSFGPKTRDALKWFQSEFGMEADGLAGPKTKLKLYNATKNWKPGMEYANTGGNAKPQTGTANKTGGGGESGGGKVKAESTDLSASNAMGLSENDLRIMANAVYGESRGEPFEGQVAVAAVILNRVKSPSFPNTVSGVIFQPGAFTAVADGQIWLEPNDQARKAVQQALNGWDPTGGCIYYFNPNTATSKWIWSRPQVKTIGEHIFCM
ncbi:spore cortex-lytic enzyme [Paenibacillus timonensis]|uniref:Spore cortex-lytic enzyme n=1 Tax=Paenibacillus timonensis TaxID=225915 RepID=A0ABW3SDX6_9BACL|nr:MULTISPECIES: spore cortex-lytic enzyme [Paenibacillus]MCH1640649.1 spore cortex-lytic enzyme [Paenibacillus timonensis]MDU2242140.1 spore cortex-lytic enzyme [Paenibacillus sp.]